MDSAINWFTSRQGKVSYSMAYRNGPSSYDCSSAVYYALTQGGLFTSYIRIGNTDSLFGDLERNGWVQLTADSQGNVATQRGDVFIWGKRGASGGAKGHAGEFVDAINIIHCSAAYNGIHIDNHDQFSGWNGSPDATFYRYVGGSSKGDEDQVVTVGSYIKFDKSYRTDDAQLIGGVWQTRTDELAPNGFTWEDNGIPTEPLVEVDLDGYATEDQHLDYGSLYKIPGKFRVLDVTPNNMALIEWNGLKFWVDVSSATEVLEDNPGTPIPSKRPTPPPVTVDPPIEIPNTPVIDLPVHDPGPITTVPSQPPITQPIKENKPMAFSPEQAKELLAQQDSVLLNNADDFTPVISTRVKTITYFITDTSLVVSTFVFTVLAVLGIVDAVVGITLNAAIAAAMLGLKTIFKISAKK